jgi:predicted DNA-binding protein
MAERALARHRGRPSVTGGNARTPSLTVRVPPETRAALEELARAQGKRLADVSREALDEYVSRHAS